MAKSRDSSNDLREKQLLAIYLSRLKEFERSPSPEVLIGRIRSDFRASDVVPVPLEKQLRHFAVWCARTVCHLNTSEVCKVVLETAERFLVDEATREQLERVWDDSYRVTTPAGMVGMPHRCTNAAAALACAHVANPNVFEAAKWAASYATTAQVWNRLKVPDKPRPIRVVWNLYVDGKFKKAVHIGHPDPYYEAERQVRREIEVDQAEQLRRLIPNPFVELA